jgi:hypothetical protein
VAESRQRRESQRLKQCIAEVPDQNKRQTKNNLKPQTKTNASLPENKKIVFKLSNAPGLKSIMVIFTPVKYKLLWFLVRCNM